MEPAGKRWACVAAVSGTRLAWEAFGEGWGIDCEQGTANCHAWLPNEGWSSVAGLC